MLELFSFAFGAGFSILVYVLSIRPSRLSPARKAAVAFISTIGITGMVWLSGIVVAHFLRKLFPNW